MLQNREISWIFNELQNFAYSAGQMHRGTIHSEKLHKKHWLRLKPNFLPRWRPENDPPSPDEFKPMSKLDANRSPERRLDEFIKQISAPEIQGDINQPAKETSRWIKWGFSNAEATTPSYQIVKKSESKIFNRLLDRIDTVAGRARQEANKEITRMLEDSGVEVTQEIKKHLPDKHKLGNAKKLAYEIKSAIAAKEATKKETQEKLNREMPEILQNYLKDFGKTNKPVRDILRNDSPEKSQFKLYMQPLFQDMVNYFVQDFLGDLKKINDPMNADQLKLLIHKKQNDFFRAIINSSQWMTVKSMFEDECVNAAVDLHDAKIFSAAQKGHFYHSIKALSSSILTFASLSSFLADAVASSINELNTEFSRLLNTKNQSEIMKMTAYFSGCLNTIAAESANKNV